MSEPITPGPNPVPPPVDWDRFQGNPTDELNRRINAISTDAAAAIRALNGGALPAEQAAARARIDVLMATWAWETERLNREATAAASAEATRQAELTR